MRPWVPPDVRSRATATAARGYTETATIGRHTLGGGRAGQQETWPPTGLTFPCRKQALRKVTMNPVLPQDGQVQDRVFYILHYPLSVGQSAATADPVTGAWFSSADKLTIGDQQYTVSNADDPATDAYERVALIWRKA